MPQSAARGAEPRRVLYTETGLPLYGGIVTDPDEIAAIRRRIYGRTDPGIARRAWRRVLRRIRRGR